MVAKISGRLGRLLLVVIVVASPLAARFARADTGGLDGPAWAAPTAITVKKVGETSVNMLDATAYNGNIDCSPGQTQLPASSEFRSACWMSTVFGLYDPGSSLIANLDGPTRAAPLVSYDSGTILPWGNSLDALDLNSAAYGGAYVSLYKDLPEVMRGDYAALGTTNLIDQRLTEPPDMAISDYDGQRLRVNPSSLAFSSSGSWVVVETMNGAFARYNLATLDETRFAPSFQQVGGAAGLSESEVAVSNDGRYAAIFNNAASSLKVYDLTNCAALAADALYQNCPSHDYWSFANSQIDKLTFINRLRFMNDGLISFQAVSAGVTYDYELAPRAGITSLIDYLGLGDSYTSGEGAYNYEAGTDTGIDVCHLSLGSYPLLLSHDVFTGASGHSVACSGAKIGDIMPKNSGRYYGQNAQGQALSSRQESDVGQILAGYLPGYLPQEEFVSQYQPAALSVSVGGDDIGFSDIVETCALPHISLHISDQTCYNSYEDRLEALNRINAIVPHWAALYEHLLASDPGGRVYAIGYPEVAVDNGNCADNVHLDKSEIEFTEELVNYLNGAIQQAAAVAGVNYVDVTHALDGHRLCEAKSYDLAMNGLTAGTDIKVFGDPVLAKESFHPNALGQELLEQAILSATKNLTTPMPAISVTAPPNDSTTLLNAPKSGRKVYKSKVAEVTVPKAAPGAKVSVHVGGLDNGLVPGNTYTVHIGGSDGATIGTLTGGDDGDLDGSATIPSGGDSGATSIDITGTDQDGGPVDVTQPIYIPVNPTDTDGDGIPDSADTCPTVPNSDHDIDHNGIDDACEAVIGSNNSSNNGQSSGTNTSTTPSTTDASGAGSTTPGSATGGSSTVTPSSTSNANPDGQLTVTNPVPTQSNISVQSPDSDNVDASFAATAAQLNPVAATLGTVTANPQRLTKSQVPYKAAVHTAPFRLPALRILDWLLWGIVACTTFVLLQSVRWYCERYAI